MAIPSPGSWSRTLGPQRSLFETFRCCQDHSSGALVYHPVPVSLRRPALRCTRSRFPGARVVLPLLLSGLFLAGCGGGAGVEQAGPLTGTVMETDRTWRCNGLVDLDLVKVTIDGSKEDAVHLNRGCTGVIRRLEITGTGGDGVKVHADAHDLEILGGRIDCGPKARGKHQDAIQAMGGTRVTFRRHREPRLRQLFHVHQLGSKEAPEAGRDRVLGLQGDDEQLLRECARLDTLGSGRGRLRVSRPAACNGGRHRPGPERQRLDAQARLEERPEGKGAVSSGQWKMRTCAVLETLRFPWPTSLSESTRRFAFRALAARGSENVRRVLPDTA